MKAVFTSPTTRVLAILILSILSLTAAANLAFCQTRRSTRDLKKLTLKELMDIQVSTVTRQSEKLSESASAAQVITGEDIWRSGSVAWTPFERHTVWAAVSRAVRSPSRFDTEVAFPIVGDPEFESEKVNAYELGYHVRPMLELSLSLAALL